MAKLDTRAFPELKRMMSRRERERNYVMSRKHLGDGKGEDILQFWQELAERIQEEEDLDNMEAILREIKGDISMLQSLQQTLMITRDESDHATQITALIRLIAMLLDIFEQYKKWHWQLRDRALAFFLAVNPAMPSKAHEKYESKKDKKKAGQAKAKKANEEAKQPAQKKGPKTKPGKRPGKKMQA